MTIWPRNPQVICNPMTRFDFIIKPFVTQYIPVLCLILYQALSTTPLSAYEIESNPEFEHLYELGRYGEAAMKAEGIGSPNMYAFAARSQIAQVVTARLGPGDVKILEQAEINARKALAQDDKNVEALIQLVVVLGLKARSIGNLSAYLAGLPNETKGYLDKALSLAPEHPVVMSVYGAWHLEVVAKAGENRAAEWYNASINSGIDLFETALEKDPNNIPILYNYALLRLENHENLEADNMQIAHQLLVKLRINQPQEWLDVVLRERALNLISEIEKKDDQGLSTLVDRHMSVI